MKTKKRIKEISFLEKKFNLNKEEVLILQTGADFEKYGLEFKRLKRDVLRPHKKISCN